MIRTTLDLLECGDLLGAIEMMERLRVEVPCEPGEEIPWQQLPLLPLGEELDRFTKALARFEIQDPDLLRRLDELKPWLIDLHLWRREEA